MSDDRHRKDSPAPVVVALAVPVLDFACVTLCVRVHTRPLTPVRFERMSP